MIKQFIYSLLFSCLLASCAVQVPPSGGAKDVEPPKVEKMIPPNKSINFQNNEINIRFNEFILLNNPTDQIVISPPLDEKPELTINGKLLTITFLSALKRNTTYTINFGNAITDNHEGNVLENLRYVFSTGQDLDSNKLSASVLNSFTTKPEKEISVGLYSTEDYTDSTIYKTKPLYFSKSKDNGSVLLENIPDKDFYMVAFNDENKNLKYDKNEVISFIKDPINSKDTLSKRFLLFNPDAYSVNRLLDTFSRDLGKFCFLIYKPTNIKIKPIKDVPFYTWKVSGKPDIDSIFIYSNNLVTDSIVSFKINQPDTSYTLEIKPRKKAKIPPFEVNISTRVELGDSIQILSSNPFNYIDTTRIVFKDDTIRVIPIFIQSNNANQYSVIYNLTEKKRYSIEVKDSAFKDIYGQYNRKKRADIAMKSLKDYSSLKLNLLLNKTSELYIIQLINDNETIIFKEFTISEGEEKLFDYLLPGSYRIKIIKDTNKNGKWDNGDYSKKRQPESVYYHPESIVLKAFWDLEQTIDLTKLIKE